MWVLVQMFSTAAWSYLGQCSLTTNLLSNCLWSSAFQEGYLVGLKLDVMVCRRHRPLGRRCSPRQNRHAVSGVRFIASCGGRAALCFLLPSLQPYQVTAFGPPAALLYYCRFLCLHQVYAVISLRRALHFWRKFWLYEFTQSTLLSAPQEIIDIEWLTDCRYVNVAAAGRYTHMYDAARSYFTCTNMDKSALDVCTLRLVSLCYMRLEGVHIHPLL